jgi:hypothetical protein
MSLWLSLSTTSLKTVFFCKNCQSYKKNQNWRLSVHVQLNSMCCCLSVLFLITQDAVRPSGTENVSCRNKKMEGTNGPDPPLVPSRTALYCHQKMQSINSTKSCVFLYLVILLSQGTAVHVTATPFTFKILLLQQHNIKVCFLIAAQKKPNLLTAQNNMT